MRADHQGWALGIVGLLGSVLALGLAPLVLPDSYSWVEQTTSESGAQGVEGAWVARTGFLLFGLAVLWIVYRSKHRWSRWATLPHLVFAISMIGVAVYSLRSWFPGAKYDEVEDLLHSVGATAMGFAFAFGVTAVAFRGFQSGGRWRFFDIIAVVASVVLPVGMGLFGSIDGVLQRLMFLVAYVWYAREALIPDASQGRAIESPSG